MAGITGQLMKTKNVPELYLQVHRIYRSIKYSPGCIKGDKLNASLQHGLEAQSQWEWNFGWEEGNKIGMTYQWWTHNASNFELQVVMNKVEAELKLRRGYFPCVFMCTDAFVRHSKTQVERCTLCNLSAKSLPNQLYITIKTVLPDLALS